MNSFLLLHGVLLVVKYEYMNISRNTKIVFLISGDRFQSYRNSNVDGGTLVASATTNAMCEAACLRTKAGDPDFCIGYDFKVNGHCYLHTHPSFYIINSDIPGVTHYKRIIN